MLADATVRAAGIRLPFFSGLPYRRWESAERQSGKDISELQEQPDDVVQKLFRRRADREDTAAVSIRWHQCCAADFSGRSPVCDDRLTGACLLLPMAVVGKKEKYFSGAAQRPSAWDIPGKRGMAVFHQKEAAFYRNCWRKRINVAL